MPTKQAQLLHKRGPRAPDATEIDVGEVAINTAAGKLYVKTDGGDVISVSGGEGGTGSAVTISETAPPDASAGDEWFCSKEGEEALYIFDGDVWFGIPVGGDIVAPEPKDYALGTTTRSGDVVLSIVDDALSVKTHDGETKWNMEGDELIGNARAGEVNLPLQEQ